MNEDIIDCIASALQGDKKEKKEMKAEHVAQIRKIILKMIQEKRKPVRGGARRRLRAGVIAFQFIYRMIRGTYMRRTAVATLARVLKSINPDESTKKRLEDQLTGILRPKEMDKVLGEVTFEMRRGDQIRRAQEVMRAARVAAAKLQCCAYQQCKHPQFSPAKQQQLVTAGDAKKLGSMKGPSFRCKVCNAVAYCSKKCQKAHFKKHKKECAKLAQASSRDGVGHPEVVIAYDALEVSVRVSVRVRREV